MKSDSKIMTYLINQCKNPTGIVGNLMINIWNKTFIQMAIWGCSNININNSDIVLEIGCGGGVFIEYLTSEKNIEKIYGIDISKLSIQKATALNKKFIRTNKVTLLQGTVIDTSLQKGIFTKAFAIQTHIYWTEIEITIEKVFNLLDIGGEFNIICEKDKIHYHLPKYEKKESMSKMLKQCGFNKGHIFETTNWIQYQCFKRR